MATSGIYKIQSKCKPERIYIGSAVNIRGRWSQHKWYLRRNKHHTSKLQRHYNKYGESDLVFTILITCDVDELLKYEQFFLDSLNPFFNTCKIAGNSSGVKASEETRSKLRITSRGNKGRKGQHLSEEHKHKISEAQMGENNSMYGKPAPNKGKKMPPNKWKGKKGRYSEETLEKMRISNKRAWEIRKLKKAA